MFRKYYTYVIKYGNITDECVLEILYIGLGSDM